MHTRKLTWKDKNVCKYGTSFRACTWLPSLYRWVPCCACHEDEENRPTSSSALFYVKTIKDKIWEYIKGEILYTWLSQQNFRSLKLNLKCGTWSCEYDIHYSGQNSILHVKKNLLIIHLYTKTFYIHLILKHFGGEEILKLSIFRRL